MKKEKKKLKRNLGDFMARKPIGRNVHTNKYAGKGPVSGTESKYQQKNLSGKGIDARIPDEIARTVKSKSVVSTKRVTLLDILQRRLPREPFGHVPFILNGNTLAEKVIHYMETARPNEFAKLQRIAFKKWLKPGANPKERKWAVIQEINELLRRSGVRRELTDDGPR